LSTTPALRCRFSDDANPEIRELLAAEIDGSSATAIHEANPHEWRVFYPTTTERDAAGTALAEFCRAHRIALHPIEIDDEDWARRSQSQLKAVRVGDIIVAPPWDVPGRREAGFRGPEAGDRLTAPGLRPPAPGLPIVIIIEPSTGFGTGHHASTRLCLLALQTLDLRNRRVIDVGTGSGVLAIAAARLGAAGVLAIDTDADAVQSARANVARNLVRPTSRSADVIDIRLADVAMLAAEPADVLVANLTAAWLRRLADAIVSLVRPGGTLVVSGLQNWETACVLDGYAGRAVAALVLSDDGWTSVIFKTRGNSREACGWPHSC
jgi:ribosomal protein L11 methyltransferase